MTKEEIAVEVDRLDPNGAGFKFSRKVIELGGVLSSGDLMMICFEIGWFTSQKVLPEGLKYRCERAALINLAVVYKYLGVDGVRFVLKHMLKSLNQERLNAESESEWYFRIGLIRVLTLLRSDVEIRDLYAGKKVTLKLRHLLPWHVIGLMTELSETEEDKLIEVVSEAGVL
jgi:hypothetical protein